ncbi:hypothetical protein PSHT_03480 [Puccinia striiformis]|uniref:Uncharacterized protein n=1 Tax=Puccinia striiformis TaxID=27350 RepID=A0A2S4WFD2_9BASI|nr:hypothetical protein PSHT_03480 [Puccinia striiformis]
MVEFYTELQIHILGAEFFTSRRSIIPDLEFLTSGWDVRHFHRSIKGVIILPFLCLILLTYRILMSLLTALLLKIGNRLSIRYYHIRKTLPSTQLSGRFTEICEEFRRPGSWGGRSLSSALSHAGLDMTM